MSTNRSALIAQLTERTLVDAPPVRSKTASRLSSKKRSQYEMWNDRDGHRSASSGRARRDSTRRLSRVEPSGADFIRYGNGNAARPPANEPAFTLRGPESILLRHHRINERDGVARPHVIARHRRRSSARLRVR